MSYCLCHAMYKQVILNRCVSGLDPGGHSHSVLDLWILFHPVLPDRCHPELCTALQNPHWSPRLPVPSDECWTQYGKETGGCSHTVYNMSSMQTKHHLVIFNASSHHAHFVFSTPRLMPISDSVSPIAIPISYLVPLRSFSMFSGLRNKSGLCVCLALIMRCHCQCLACV